MANSTTFQVPDYLVPNRVNSNTAFFNSFTSPTSGNAAADYIFLGNLPIGTKITDAALTISATLGASCTLQLVLCKQDGTSPVALTAASTAAQANNLPWNGHLQVVDANTQMVALVIAGAGTTAAALVSGYVEFSNP